MYGEYVLDSYQNLVCGPGGNESVESITPEPDRGSVEHASHDAGEDEERASSGDLSSDRAGGGGRRRQGSSGRDGEVRGRAASGEAYEDGADDALFRPEQDAVTTDTYEGGNLSPTGKTIERAKGRKQP